jgi:hypothetical protein
MAGPLAGLKVSTVEVVLEDVNSEMSLPKVGRNRLKATSQGKEVAAAQRCIGTERTRL